MFMIMKSNDKTVLVGMSGGVDSSVAALLLKREGYRVIGAFMKNFSESKNKLTGECNWIEDQRMAKRVAGILGIEFITLDFEKEFGERVINPLFRDYSRGLTPNPDILCNKIIKFPLLWREAKRIGADFIATGHYARIKRTRRGFELLAGKDKGKDQSYFLAELGQKDLGHTLFPLGNLMKGKVREIARKARFPNFDRQGSRGICFVGKVDLRSFLGQKIKGRKGQVIDKEGKIIGYHPGAMYYTIGQRIGERLGFELLNDKGNDKLYIAAKKGNTIVAVPAGDDLLKRKEIKINGIHFIGGKESKGLKARIRHLGKLYGGKLKGNKFVFSKPVEALAEGQFIVIYSGEKVLASGEMRF